MIELNPKGKMKDRGGGSAPHGTAGRITGNVKDSLERQTPPGTPALPQLSSNASTATTSTQLPAAAGVPGLAEASEIIVEDKDGEENDSEDLEPAPPCSRCAMLEEKNNALDDEVDRLKDIMTESLKLQQQQSQQSQQQAIQLQQMQQQISDQQRKQQQYKDRLQLQQKQQLEHQQLIQRQQDDHEKQLMDHQQKQQSNHQEQQLFLQQQQVLQEQLNLFERERQSDMQHNVLIALADNLEVDVSLQENLTSSPCLVVDADNFAIETLQVAETNTQDPNGSEKISLIEPRFEPTPMSTQFQIQVIVSSPKSATLLANLLVSSPVASPREYSDLDLDNTEFQSTVELKTISVESFKNIQKKGFIEQNLSESFLPSDAVGRPAAPSLGGKDSPFKEILSGLQPEFPVMPVVEIEPIAQFFSPRISSGDLSRPLPVIETFVESKEQIGIAVPSTNNAGSVAIDIQPQLNLTQNITSVSTTLSPKGSQISFSGDVLLKPTPSLKVQSDGLAVPEFVGNTSSKIGSNEKHDRSLDLDSSLQALHHWGVLYK